MLKLTVKPFILSAAVALSLTTGLPQAGAEEMGIMADIENGIVYKEVSDVDPNYCHIKYRTFTEQGLKSGNLEFHGNEVIDHYGSCSFDPKHPEEVKKQLALLNQGMGGDSNDADSGSD